MLTQTSKHSLNPAAAKAVVPDFNAPPVKPWAALSELGPTVKEGVFLPGEV